MNNDYITIDNGITVIQQRRLLEVTDIMARALNEQEYNAIMKFYEEIADRILPQE